LDSNSYDNRHFYLKINAYDKYSGIENYKSRKMIEVILIVYCNLDNDYDAALLEPRHTYRLMYEKL